MGLALHNSTDALDFTQRYLSSDYSEASRSRPHAQYHGALTSFPAEHKNPLLDHVLFSDHQKRQPQRHRQARRRQTSGLRTLGRRVPSLERQDAFRDPRTTKSRVCLDQDSTDQFRRDTLFDDEHLGASRFDRAAIHGFDAEHTTRPAKLARRSRPRYHDDLQLALDLSLAELGRDEAFAQYLCSPDLGELFSGDEGVYGARLAPLHLISELVHYPEYFSHDISAVTTASDPNPVSFRMSSSPDE
ncbi:hypothetical protein CCHL11_03139 [Colletotrichum chlorophyti]|uniref:Uncharacterized protein n=1 Tax=Colletotrichum chlorophyti TaxID=708187 RepID=A0A1Q8RGC1_9PEZI|nr:hypothetical protein CCHL11_03139 [Colletotrichum chlorophyti]